MNETKSFVIEHIPPVPTVMMTLMRFDPTVSENDVAALERIIMPDKGISSEILKVANSALYGRSGKIKDLHGAITLMGVKPTRNLIILLSTKKFKTNLKSETYKKCLVEYPIVAALVALDVCRPAGMSAAREDIFLGTLLHKIGMTIIALNQPVVYKDLLDDVIAEGINLIALEEQQFGTNHIAVGQQLFEAWKIPEEIQIIISEHPSGSVLQSTPIVQIVALAGMIARRLLGLWESPEDRECFKALQLSLKLGDDKIDPFFGDYFEMIRTHPFYEQSLA